MAPRLDPTGTEARALQDVVLECRTFGHSWDRFAPPGARSMTVHLRCTRCSTERHDTVNGAGDVTARRYIYPPGYRGALPRTVFRSELRRELLRRRRNRARKRK